MIKFSKPTDLWGQLSNFWPCDPPLIFQGQEYATSEHLYQAMKYIFKGAPEINSEYVHLIRTSSTPFKAKLLSRQLCLSKYSWQSVLSASIKEYQQKGIQHRADWDEKRDEIMLTVLMVKFSQNEKCAKILLSTNDEMLQEESATDSYWAAGRDGKGQNRLGQLLCQVRTTLREE